MEFFKKLLWIGTFAVCHMIPLLGQTNEENPLEFIQKGKKETHPNGIFQGESFDHNIQLQLADSFGIPVPGTQFWVKLKIVKEGEKVTIQLPQINFVTGPTANAPFELPFLPPRISGGYLYTSDGFLPKNLRPNDVVYRSILGASNDGLSLSFSFAQNPNTFHVPPVGYIVSITNAGALAIQGAGTFGNIIPAGAQILLPSDMTYLAQTKKERRHSKLKKNIVLSRGATNTTQFTGSSQTGAAGTGVRDTHINDAFDGVAAWAWTDNSMIPDKTNNTLNVMVAVGKNKDGKLKVRDPIQLTDLPPGIFAWDTAVAINRINKKNIVVSYAILNAPSTPFRAVSFDGGKTWPHNGPMNIQPSGPNGAGDNRGVSSDRFGNIWYSSTNFEADDHTIINQPYFAASADGGITFELIYTLPPPPANVMYDFPQFCFGGDGQGNYGLQFTTDFINTVTGDLAPVVGFIPILGLGVFGTPATPILLTEFTNNNQTPSITASLDGRVWYLGTPSGEVPGELPNPGTSISTIRTVFKSPGPLDQNYAGPWDFAQLNLLNEFFFFTGNEISQPFFGFIHNTPQSNLYDEGRQALYGIVSAHFPDNSQNMRLYFRISRDNGQTWSNTFNIANNQSGNRGFQSMALDPVKGDLYFGWYDGRNDPTFKSLEYFAAIIPAKQLDKMIKNIPLANPMFTLPPAGVPCVGGKVSFNPLFKIFTQQNQKNWSEWKKKFPQLARAA
jgi:hypothetical protein